MTHLRQTLRHAAVAAVTGLAATGANVKSGRIYPWQRIEMPCLEVSTPGDDTPEEADLAGTLQQREGELEIIATVRATEDLADELDAVCEQVETAIADGLTVASQAVPLTYAGTSIEFSGEIDQPIARAVMRWRYTLFTFAGAPGAHA